MSSCQCDALPCPSCFSCPVCECACGSPTLPLDDARPPPAKRPRPSPTPFLSAPLPVPLLARDNPDFPAPAPHPPNPASAHSCIVSSNDRGHRAHAKWHHARDSLAKLLALLDLDPRSLPALLYDPPAANFDHPSSPSAVHLMTTIIRHVAPLICPADPDGLAARFVPRPSPDARPASSAQEMVVANVITAMKATRRGTLARRYIRSVLCGTMTRADVNALLGYSDDQSEQNGSVITSGPVDSGRVTGPITGSSTFPKPADDDDPDDDDYDDDEGDTGRDARDRLPKMSSKTFSRSRRDWDTLLERGELQPAKFGRARVRDEALRQLLTFLFSPENVVLVSWTAQRIVVHGRKLDIPALVSAKSGSALHEAYCKLLKGKNTKPLSRGSFYAVAKTLTRREVTRVLAVDNMTQTLVRDPLILLRDIIMRGIPYPHRSAFLKRIDRVEWFLIHSFVESHLGQDLDGFHDLDFALRSDRLMGNVRTMADRYVQCKGCLFPFLLLADVQAVAQLQKDSPDAKTVKNCQDRFIYYLGHLCRKTAQSRGIEEAVDEIASKRLYNRVMVFMSHLSYDEAVRTGKEHLIPNEEDVSIFGSVVVFHGKKQNKDAQNAKEITASDLENRFYAHLVCNDSHSDVRVAAVVVEALLHRLSLDVPHAEEVIFVSDNAAIYKNHILPALIPRLATEMGLRALRYIYTCSQQCELLVEAHFELVMGIGEAALRTGELLTPMSLVNAINTEKEHLNLAAELISLDENFHAFSMFMQNDSAGFPSIGVKNDVEYEERQVDPANPDESGSVITRLHDFSGVGTASIFEIMDSSVKALKRLMGYTGGEATRRSSSEFHSFGPVTGVEVTMGARALSSSCLSRPPLANGVSEGVVADILSRLRFNRTATIVDETSSTPDMGVSGNGSSEMGSRTCADCRRSFKSESFQKSHACKGSPLDKDVSARAVVVATEMLHEGSLPVFRDPSEHLLSDSASFQGTKTRAIEGVWFAWARNRIPEDCMESARSQEYRKEIFERLDREGEDQKADPSDMRSFLRAKYVGRNDIPKEKIIRHWYLLHEATKRIQPFYMTAVDGAPIVSYNEDTPSAGGGRSRMNPRYLAKITAMHQQHLSLPELKRPKPRYMYKEFEHFFRDGQGRLPPDFPGQKQVMNKINALRTKSKQR